MGSQLRAVTSELGLIKVSNANIRAATTVTTSFPSWNRSMLTEIDLCRACSCHKILRMEALGQVMKDDIGSVTPKVQKRLLKLFAQVTGGRGGGSRHARFSRRHRVRRPGVLAPGWVVWAACWAEHQQIGCYLGAGRG
jgi:hypothetical protein